MAGAGTDVPAGERELALAFESDGGGAWSLSWSLGAEQGSAPWPRADLFARLGEALREVDVRGNKFAPQTLVRELGLALEGVFPVKPTSRAMGGELFQPLVRLLVVRELHAIEPLREALRSAPPAGVRVEWKSGGPGDFAWEVLVDERALLESRHVEDLEAAELVVWFAATRLQGARIGRRRGSSSAPKAAGAAKVLHVRGALAGQGEDTIPEEDYARWREASSRGLALVELEGLVRVLEDLTPTRAEDVLDSVRRDKPTLLHWYGHSRDGRLLLVGPDGGEELDPADLAAACRAAGVAVVVLHACRGHEGLAQALLDGGVPHVVAHQVRARSAVPELVARGFVAWLAWGRSVGEALREARRTWAGDGRYADQLWTVFHGSSVEDDGPILAGEESLVGAYLERASQHPNLTTYSVLPGAPLLATHLIGKGGFTRYATPFDVPEPGVEIVGVGGAGKTTLMQSAWRAAVDRGLVPVWVRLPDWDDRRRRGSPSAGTLLQQVLAFAAHTVLGRAEDDERTRRVVEALEHCAGEGRLMLVFDAVDELDDRRREDAARDLAALRSDLAATPGNRVFVVSRPLSFEVTRHLTELERVDPAPVDLDSPVVREFLERQVTSESWERVRFELGRPDSPLRAAVETPLFLHVVALALSREGIDPSDHRAVFRAAVHEMLIRGRRHLVAQRVPQYADAIENLLDAPEAVLALLRRLARRSILDPNAVRVPSGAEPAQVLESLLDERLEALTQGSPSASKAVWLLLSEARILRYRKGGVAWFHPVARDAFVLDSLAGESADEAVIEVRKAVLAADSEATEYLERELLRLIAVAQAAPRGILNSAQTMVRALDGVPGRGLERARFVARSTIGDALAARGDWAAAAEEYESLREEAEALSQTLPESFDALRSLVVVWNRLGDVRRIGKDRAGAEEAYLRGKAVVEKLVRAFPERVQAHRDLSMSFDRLGSILFEQYDWDGAEAAYTSSKEIDERIAAAHPDSPQALRDVSISWNQLGDVRARRGDWQGARKAYEAVRHVRERLAEESPDSAQPQRDLWVSLMNVGHAHFMCGMLAEAERASEAGLKIAERLARAFPDSPEARRDLSVSWDRLGDARLEGEAWDGAEEAFVEAMELARKLAADFPGWVEVRLDLALMWNHIGDARRGRGSLKEAAEAYDAGLEVSQELAREYPDDHGALRSLSLSWERMGVLRFRRDDLQGAIAAFSTRLEIATSLVERFGGDVRTRTEWVTGALHAAMALRRADLLQDAIQPLQGALLCGLSLHAAGAMDRDRLTSIRDLLLDAYGAAGLSEPEGRQRIQELLSPSESSD